MPPAYPFPTPLPVVSGGYLCRVYGLNTGSGTPVTQQFAFQTVGAGTYPDAESVARAVASAYEVSMLDLVHTSYTSSQVGVYSLETATTVEAFAPMTGPGRQTGVAAPPNITSRVRFNTAVRRKRGSVHMSPISDFAIDPGGNHVTDDYKTLLEVKTTTFIGDILSDPVWGENAIFHRILSLITNKAYDGRMIPVTSIVAQKNLGSVRRRRGY